MFTSTGVFALLNAYALLKYMQSLLTKKEFQYLFYVSVVVAAGVVFVAVVGLTWAGELVSTSLTSGIS